MSHDCPSTRFRPSGSSSQRTSSANLASSLGELRHILGSDGTPEVSFVHQSPQLARLLDTARMFAATCCTVLITGESGTGKEVLARWIHAQSPRAQRPFHSVNCAALTESLYESELFGHEPGAFTGATSRREGRIEHARGGTLLLDEISEIPLSLQAKLLRVLEEGEFQRVGSNQSLPVEARMIVTSNRRLQEAVSAGTFRLDLYYRLNVLHLELPPLRERRQDIPILAQHFLVQASRDLGREVHAIAPAALQRLEQHSWPGNVRELRNAIHRGCAVNRTGRLELEDLPPLTQTAEPDGSEDAFALWEDMKLAEIERRAILWNLRRFRGNKAAVARHLGVATRTIANKLREYAAQGLREVA